MKKIMISQPIANKTEKEIKETRDEFLIFAEKNNYEVVNTLFTDEWYSDKSMNERGVRNIPLCFIAKSLESMSLCDAAYFAKGWEDARGCKIEHDVAKAYGLEIYYLL